MTKITELPQTTTMAAGDLIAVVSNPGSTPVTQKVSFGDFTAVQNRVLNQSVYDTFTTKGTTALTVSDSGHTYAKTTNGAVGAGLSIINGKLSNTSTVPGISAGYAELPLQGQVTRIGCKFTLSPYTTNGGAVCLAIWEQSITALTGTGAIVVPNAPVHFTIGANGWGLSYYWAGVPVTVTAGIVKLTADGSTVHKVELILDGTILTLLLPDGSVWTATDSHFGSIIGRWANWEVYGAQTVTDSKAAIIEVWADDTPQGTEKSRIQSTLRVNAFVQRAFRSGFTYTAIGRNAVANPTSASYTAIGFSALNALTTGGQNVAIGEYALSLLTTGINNTAVGCGSLQSTNGDNNTAFGQQAGMFQTTGAGNTLIGKNAGNTITTESNNTYIGLNAGASGAGPQLATAIGFQAQTNGYWALALGSSTAASADGAVAIGTDSGGNGASSAVVNRIVLGTANHTLMTPAAGLGFYGTTPITKQTGVAVTAAGIHAACVALGLFTA